MSNRLIKWAILSCAVLAAQVQAHNFYWVDKQRHNEHRHFDKHHQPQANIQREREALNRERDRMHRSFDARMRELDQHNREIDRWQSSHRHDHQRIARIANEKRAQLNRERDHLNRERDQMNRYYDQLNRELDHRQQRVSHSHPPHRRHHH